MADIELVIKIPKEIMEYIKNNGCLSVIYIDKVAEAIKNGTPLEEIPNPCIECSQNCCVRELNGEKCECQKVYVVKENKE